MSQGLFTAASGIAANQAKVDVISDNIANINTVGFKSSQINFETVFSKVLSAGAAPSDDVGGINPMEIGLGVAVGEIGRNFDNGSIQTTGRTTDLNIQGEGFFTMQNYDGQVFFTRAGNFSTDANGFLVNPAGLKVIGTASATSNNSGTTPVQIPTTLNIVTPNALAGDTITDIGQQSGSTVTTGIFTVNISDGTTNSDVTVTVSTGNSLSDVASSLQAALRASAEDVDGDITVSVGGTDSNQLIITTPDSENITFSGSSTDTSNFLSVMGFTPETATAGDFTITIAGGAAQTVTLEDGDSLTTIANKLQAAIDASGDDADGDITVTATGNQITIDTSQGLTNETIVLTDGTSNFATVAGLAGAASSGYSTTFDLQSAALVDHSQVTIDDHNDTGVDPEKNYSVTTFSISNDGALEVTYSNGGKLTVANNDLGNRELKYVSPNGREIETSGIDNYHTSLNPAQLQIQLANVINPKGLNAVGGNLFALNSIAGEPTYAMGRTGGLGVINSGSLEASNVDLPKEFAGMILAQRGVEANSRTFSVQDQIMRQIVNLGR